MGFLGIFPIDQFQLLSSDGIPSFHRILTSLSLFNSYESMIPLDCPPDFWVSMSLRCRSSKHLHSLLKIDGLHPHRSPRVQDT